MYRFLFGALLLLVMLLPLPAQAAYRTFYPYRGYYHGYYNSPPRYDYHYWRGPSSAFYYYNYPFYYYTPYYYYGGGPGLYTRFGF